jgi:type IV pilus modification protein PilV
MRTDGGNEMTVRQRKLTMIRKSRGLSMLDVLVAIVVLATGLLALAALQGALTRNGADSRTRSQIAAYTQSIIDRMRFAGYDAVVPGTVTSGQTISPGTCSGTLTLAQQMACDAKTAQTAAGVSNLQTTITGAEWWGSGGTFTTTAPTNTAGVANYKQVNVTTTWTDAVGAARSVSFDTTVSQQTVSPTDSTLNNKVFVLPTGNSPRVRQASPANTAGVIPIAVSSSQDAAATNPAPLVTNFGVTFSTITYNRSADALGGNLITQRIDTKALQCSCKFMASGGVVSTDSNLTSLFQQPYQPTYWDGTQYVSPTKAASASSSTGVDPNSANNDSDCDICCRDHNDVAGNTVLFDNYSGDYRKFQYVTASGVTSLTPVTSGTFLNACRMVRVGGVYATATDVRNYFFGLLDTEPCSTAGVLNSPNNCTSATAETSAVPTATAETNYQNFVKDYLYGSLTSLTAGTGPTPDSSDPLSTTNSAVTSYNSTYQLNTPTQISIAATADTRYMHARGLFVDHLESKAQTALTNAIANCSSTTDKDTINNCALPVLPFTTVNMTELALWKSTDSTIVSLATNAAVGGNGATPKRGSVSVTPNAADAATAYAKADVGLMTSGLTGLTASSAVSTYDASNSLTDHKQFKVTGGATGGSGSGSGSVYFDFQLTGLTWLDALPSNATLTTTVAWNATSGQWGATAVTPTTGNTCPIASGSAGTANNPYCAQTYPVSTGSSPAWLFEATPTVSGCNSQGKSCTTTYYPNSGKPANATPVGLTVTVQNFNTFDSQGTETVTCAAFGPGGSTPNFTATQKATRCYNYDVDTANIFINSTAVSGTSPQLLYGTTDGGMSEGAVITIPAGISSTTNTVAGADVVKIGFTLHSGSPTIAPGVCQCASNTCQSSKQKYTPGTCAP